ncbi:MAG: transcriptional regulator [Flammeovirgaceae bacterium]|nr:transcriptional regulator [Flammeovirgaceae bacterium]MBR09218.1 transcriptional regulator [Rickettsiales bacterium]|tara:strand:+ start:174 stop:449 length:276 start_codon:yes stop_codon:yes gene_type:complete
MFSKLPSEVIQEIAEKSKKIRKSKKLSQEELAEKSGVSFGSIKRFETTGKISLESLLKIAFVLGVLGDFEKLFIQKETPKTLDDIIKAQSR